MGDKTTIFKVLAGLVIVCGLLIVLTVPTQAQSSPRWNASYWNNTSLSGPPALQRVELSAPNYNWGKGSPAPGIIQDDYFSARWQTGAHFDPGRYRITVSSDDGVRVWVGTNLLIDEWHNAANQSYTADFDIQTAGSQTVIIDYFENTGDALISFSWQRLGNVAQTGPTKAEYFNNMNLEGEPALIRYENEINFNWGQGSPAPGVINNDHFSARFTRSMDLAAGTYQFTVKADDGVRFWINGQLLVDQWYDSPALPFVVELDLPAGVTHFVATYYENVGEAQISITGTQLDGTVGGGSGGADNGSGITATVDPSYLNMRSGPGVDFDVIEVLRRGTFLVLTGNQQDYWVEVETPTGSVGWVSSRYLDFNLQFTVE